MRYKSLNICQVSLKRDIPLIIKNYENFKKIYKDIEINIICPSQEFLEFKEKLSHKEIRIFKEDDFISFSEFNNIFEQLSKQVEYKYKFKERLNWYYQQILKISFILEYINKKEENIVIWDADTILLKKINFFENRRSVMYGNFNEFHKAYYLTNKMILNELPNYYISFLNQFIAISVDEGKTLMKRLLDNQFYDIPKRISKLILSNIFFAHKEYNGSMFSEYELIGQINYLHYKKKQKPIKSLRFGLNGILSMKQICFVKFLDFKHITYEHSHINKDSENMLNRQQSWMSLVKIIVKNLVKFYLRLLKHNFNYSLVKNEKN